MNAAYRQSNKRRLEKAGYRHVAGWVPERYAKGIEEVVKVHAKRVDELLAEPMAPRGRPTKKF